jgi:hypothetical protein
VHVFEEFSSVVLKFGVRLPMFSKCVLCDFPYALHWTLFSFVADANRVAEQLTLEAPRSSN